MKKITAIIAISTIAAAFAISGCEKQEALQPVAIEEPAQAPSTEMTSTTTTPEPDAAPAQSNENE